MNVLSTEFYATPGRHTDVTGFGLQVSSVEEAVRAVQGLLVYDLAAKDLYGVELTAAQAGAVHERDAAALLELARTIDPRPLDQPRNPGERIGGRCNTYTLLTVALLRAAGVPAISLRVRRTSCRGSTRTTGWPSTGTLRNGVGRWWTPSSTTPGSERSE